MQRKVCCLCRLISLSCDKLVVLEVVLLPKQLARCKERTDIQEAGAMTFRAGITRSGDCSEKKKKGPGADSWLK